MREEAVIPVAPSPAGRALKMVWGILATGLGVLYTAALAPMAAIVSPFSQDLVSRIGRLWARMIIVTCGVRVEFEGVENLDRASTCVLVANHQSYFDIFALLGYTPKEVRFVAKKEWLKLPVFGFALKRSGHIVVDREHGQSIRKALNVGEGNCICIFAEGHRYNDGEVHPFKDGAAWIAIQGGLPCVPTAIIGSGAIFPRGAKVVRPGVTMRVRFGEPIPTAGLKSRERVALTQKIESSVREMYSARA